MKKRIISIVTAGMLALTCAFVIPSTTHQNDCFAKSKAKYVKVLKKKYNSMKKTIASQKTTIDNLTSTVNSQNTTITDLQQQINTLNATVKEKKSTISWLWDTLEEFGYFYNYDSHKWEEQATEPPSQEPLDWAELEQTTGIIPIMEEQTELTIDKVYIVDSWKAWVCYYVEADGCLYTITMQRGVVDVCQILN